MVRIKLVTCFILLLGSEIHIYANDTGKKDLVLWKIATQDSADSLPAKSNNIIYFSDRSGRIYAVDARTGERCWIHIDKEIFISAGERSPVPVISEKLVYYTSDYIVYALDSKSGQVTWKVRTSGTLKTPVLLGNVLYFGSRGDGYLGNGYLNAINAKTGKELWKRKIKGHMTSTPVIAGDMLLFGSSAGMLYAINIKSKKEAWKTITGDAPIATPATNNKIICVVLPGFPDTVNFKAFDLKTGKLIWGPKGPLVWDHALPVIAGNMVCFGGIMGGLIAHDTDTGRMMWNFMPFEGKTHGISGIYNSPTVSKDTVYFGCAYRTDYYLYAVDFETGKEKWKYPMEVPIRGSLLLKEGVIYFGGGKPGKYFFYAFNCKKNESFRRHPE